MSRQKTILMGALVLSLCGVTGGMDSSASAKGPLDSSQRRHFIPHPHHSVAYDAGILTFASGDVDGDGDPDVVGADLYSYGDGVQNGSSVWLNDGHGKFVERTPIAGVDWASDIHLVDFDGDADLDMLVSRWEDRGERVLLNDGTGTFTIAGEYPISYPYGSVVGDFDSDGDVDILGINLQNLSSPPSDTREQLWLNDGMGVFTESTRFELADWGGEMLPADLDGDNDLDLIVNSYPSTVVYLNDGVGGFTFNSTLSTDVNFSAVGDLDSDGDADALGMAWGAASYTIAYNDGTGSFSLVDALLGDANGYGFKLGDFDLDGDLDALLGGIWTDPEQVLLNDGTGQFSFLEALGEGGVSQNLLVDVNSDGGLDILTINNPHISSDPHAPSTWINRFFAHNVEPQPDR